MGRRIVIALGGNALGATAEEQLEKAAETAKVIADLVQQGDSVILVHGNGPQVGMIHLAMDHAAERQVIPAEMPMAECVAMSQGYIGYHLQSCIRNELRLRGIDRDVATVMTQVLVSEEDAAFSDPTKPIGTFYDKETAARIAAEKGYVFKEDAGRGYRRVVASPKPLDVIEKCMIRTLSEQGSVVIAAGGGGIPVVRRNCRLEGIDAVVDKDWASEKLAEEIGADQLVILTAVRQVYVNFGKPDQRAVNRMTPEEAKQFCEEGQFAPGSMLPKVRAAIAFAQTGGEAVIAGLANAASAIHGTDGTRVTGRMQEIA